MVRSVMARLRIHAGTFTLSTLLIAGCAHDRAAPAPSAPSAPCPASPSKPTPASATGLEYVGGTAIQAKDPKALSGWYNDHFGLPIKDGMGSGFYGGFEWNGTSFNIAIVAAGGSHPGAAPGTAYLVFHVTDYDGFIAARADKGVTPFETSSEDYGRFAKFRDPEGNEVDIWGAGKASADSHSK